MKKTIMVLMAGIFTCALVLTTCESVLTKDGDGLYDDTLINSDVNMKREIKTQIGEISGTITLTDVPNPAPQVNISVHNSDNKHWWWSGSEYINFSSDNFVNLTWSIPIYEDDGFSPSNGKFTLHVYPTDDDYGYFVNIPATPYINNVNTGGINLGTFSIKPITLSGTINITHNGQPVKYVDIWARNADGHSIDFTVLDLPAANAPWSMTVSAVNSDVTFDVYGRGNDGEFFYRESLSHISVYNQDKSGIVLNLGDITD